MSYFVFKILLLDIFLQMCLSFPCLWKLTIRQITTKLSFFLNLFDFLKSKDDLGYIYLNDCIVGTTASTSQKSVQMTNIWKRCSPFAIRNMQIKAIINCHYIPSKMFKIKKIEYQMLVKMWSNWNFHTLLVLG